VSLYYYVNYVVALVNENKKCNAVTVQILLNNQQIDNNTRLFTI